MSLASVNRLLFAKSPIPPLTTNQQKISTHSPTLPLNSRRSPTRHNNSISFRVNSFVPSKSSSQYPFYNNKYILEIIVLFAFSSILLFLRLLSNVLLPDFPSRWRNLVAFSEEAEVKCSTHSSHVWRALVAYEDRRFFQHCGIDPVGIARAFVWFSARGGGSTITQQLVKNIFLQNERTFFRKLVEMVLALALERTISKQKILSSYMSKIYWGHGIYGIESASFFYYGKHPSLLSLGESAMLAGIIPAPELRSPFRNYTRGKPFQIRVLKRMVDVGILDIETALLVAKQRLHLHADCPEYRDEFMPPLSFPGEGYGGFCKVKQRSIDSAINNMWDWEKESKIWEACEDMEQWVIRLRQRSLVERGSDRQLVDLNNKRLQSKQLN